MSDLITLSCPSCGGKLEITEDVQQFACAHCGTEHRVNRSASIVSLSPLVEGIRNVQSGVDKTASELAIKRLKGEIASLEKEYTKKHGSRNEIVLRMVGWGIVGLVGVFPLVMAAQYGEFFTFAIGLIISGFGFYLAYRNYGKFTALSRKMESTLDEARQKNAELQKHERIVSG